MRMLIPLVLGSAVLAGAGPEPARAAQAPAPITSSVLYPIHRVQKPYPLTEGLQSCDAIEFTVDEKGEARDFRVWAHYLLPDNGYSVAENWLAPNKFDRFTMQELSEWKFHPRMENNRPVSTDHVVLDTTYTSGVKLIMAMPMLEWLCMLPPMHGVPVVAVTHAEATSPPTTIVAFNATDGGEVDLGQIHVYLDSALLPKDSRPEVVWLQFCVDVSGRPSNVTVGGPNPDPEFIPAARHALEQINFPVRDSFGKSVLTCGLRVRVRFDGGARKLGDVIGIVGPIIIGTLTRISSEPKLREEKPVKISLNIPPKTKLPAVATVELRFCLEKDGSVTDATIVRADPPGLFDRAAIETAEGWRFERPAVRMCDVYEGVRFPLGGH